jgi:hypothetical protein
VTIFVPFHSEMNLLALKRAVCGLVRVESTTTTLRALTTDAAGELNVLGHDRHTLGVDRAQVGVFEKTDEVSLGRFLESHDGRSLEAEIRLEVLRDLANEALERELADEQLGGLLVATDLTKSHRAGTVTMGLLDSTGGRRRLAGCLGGELLAGSFASGGLTGGLLRTSHDRENAANRQELCVGRESGEN